MLFFSSFYRKGGKAWLDMDIVPCCHTLFCHTLPGLLEVPPSLNITGFVTQRLAVTFQRCPLEGPSCAVLTVIIGLPAPGTWLMRGRGESLEIELATSLC